MPINDLMIFTHYFSSGNKMNNIEVVYTMWENLKKTGGMDVGQVGFHKHKEVSCFLYRCLSLTLSFMNIHARLHPL